MKNLLFLIAISICNVNIAQTFVGVNIFISNPYVQRTDVIKTQMHNMDYVRSHYVAHVFSMEKNYINNLYDSLFSQPLSRVAYDSVGILVQSEWGCGTLDMNFEPCIVIDFIVDNRFNTNEEVWTFAVNRQGYVCRTFHSEGNVLCYPEKGCLDFLERRFSGMLFFRE